MANRYLFGSGRRRVVPWLLLLPGLGFYLVMGVGPSLFTTVYSLTDATGLRGLPISWVGFENYYEFLFEVRDQETTLMPFGGLSNLWSSSP